MPYNLSTCGIICHIDDYCKSNGIKYNELASSVGIDIKTLYKIRKGKRLPSVLLVGLLAATMLNRKKHSPQAARTSVRRNLPDVLTRILPLLSRDILDPARLMA